MLDGRLLDGSHGLSGEAGYSPVPSDKPVSEWKTFQEVVSEKVFDVDVEGKDFKVFQKKAQIAGELIGAQAASLAALIDPEAIVLVGVLLELDGELWPHIEKTFRRFILPAIADRVSLVHSQVDSFAAAIGATQRCFHERYPITSNANRSK
jgi:predicted NBD/HSP70 family sugar kinase